MYVFKKNKSKKELIKLELDSYLEMIKRDIKAFENEEYYNEKKYSMSDIFEHKKNTIETLIEKINKI